MGSDGEQWQPNQIKGPTALEQIGAMQERLEGLVALAQEVAQVDFDSLIPLLRKARKRKLAEQVAHVADAWFISCGADADV